MKVIDRLVVTALDYKQEVTSSIPDGTIIYIFNWYNLFFSIMFLRSIQPLTEMSTRSFPGVKPRGADNLTGLLSRLPEKMGVVSSCHSKGFLYL